MVTIVEEIGSIPDAQQAPIAGRGDVPAYVSADARHAYSIGVQACGKGDYDAALEKFDQALKLDGNFPQAWYNKGTSLGHLGRYQEAVNALDQALMLNLRLIDASHNKGVALAREGRLLEALQVFKQNLGQNPHGAQSRLGKSIVLLGLGETKAALESLQEGLAYFNGEPMLWSMIGVAYTRSGEFSEARGAFQQAFDLKDIHSTLDRVSYKAWASSIVTNGVSALIDKNISDFEAAGFTYIDVVEKAQDDGAAPIVEDALTQIKLMLRQKKRRGRQALAAFEE